DISTCLGPLEVLDELNRESRFKISNLRKHIEQLEILAKEHDKESERIKILKEVESHKNQLTSTMISFRKANVACMLTINKFSKEELFANGNEDSGLHHRQVNLITRKDKEGLVKTSSNVTEQLLSISRHLADTTQPNSSSNVHGTQDELQTTGSVISRSGKLLAKYGRREFTDKVLLLFAFAFFLACVLYIVQKRLF
ncbi:Vesicle transport protein SEC20, partial [Blattella germanica]